MAKHQTRKSISISGPTYDRFVEFCRAKGRTMSGVTDALLTALTGPDKDTTRVLMEIAEGGKMKEISSPFPLFPRSAPNPGSPPAEEKLGYDPATILARKRANDRLF